SDRNGVDVGHFADDHFRRRNELLRQVSMRDHQSADHLCGAPPHHGFPSETTPAQSTPCVHAPARSDASARARPITSASNMFLSSSMDVPVPHAYRCLVLVQLEAVAQLVRDVDGAVAAARAADADRQIALPLPHVKRYQVLQEVADPLCEVE